MEQITSYIEELNRNYPYIGENNFLSNTEDILNFMDQESLKKIIVYGPSEGTYKGIIRNMCENLSPKLHYWLDLGNINVPNQIYREAYKFTKIYKKLKVGNVLYDKSRVDNCLNYLMPGIYLGRKDETIGLAFYLTETPYIEDEKGLTTSSLELYTIAQLCNGSIRLPKISIINGVRS